MGKLLDAIGVLVDEEEDITSKLAKALSILVPDKKPLDEPPEFNARLN